MVMAVSGVVGTSAPAGAADDRIRRSVKAGRHSGPGPGIAAGQGQTSEALRAQAFNLAYNLDHEPAIALLRRAVEMSPDDPAAHRSLASVLWLNMLFKRGAVTVDHYMGSLSRARVDLKKPPADLDAEFRKHLDRAVVLAEQQVEASPRSAQAHYELGASVGLRASYVATVEGKLLAGFRAARRSFDEHERVLELDPSRKDAGLIIGTYRYVVSALSLPMRLMAYVAGFGGDRDKAIAMLETTAASSTESRTDAMFALILVYNRERRYDDALRVLEQLRRLYPKNRLVVLEHGSTALRAGRSQQADTILTEGLAMLAKDNRPRIPGEDGLWRYKRGAARAALGQADAATADLRVAVGPDSQPWVSGRARVELGRLALARGDRDSARNEARQATVLCEQGNDPACEDEASKLLRRANGR
jgi:tetratricopeptide (TPR) repeat protein